MIKAKNIHKYYGELEVLKGVDLHIKKSEIVAIVGPSGAGKTTLLQILGTLDKPTSTDSLVINNTNVIDLKDRALSKFRNKHIGFIFQFHQLLPEFTALENVCIPAYIANKPKQKVLAEAKEILDFLGLTDRISHKPNELSGGQRQRVAVARALVTDPAIILADEPTGNLDTKTGADIMTLFNEIYNAGNTIILVTHEEYIAEHANRIIRLRDGLIENDEIVRNRFIPKQTESV